MPAISLPIDALGPIIRVAVGVSQFRVDALKRANLPVPQWQVGTFLIDTGASGTCIDHALVQPLGIPPTGAVNVQTPSTGNGSHSCYQYDVLLYIPGTDASVSGLLVDCLPIIETSLSPQGIDGLIGRDVLDRCTLIYNSGIKMFTLTY